MLSDEQLEAFVSTSVSVAKLTGSISYYTDGLDNHMTRAPGASVFFNDHTGSCRTADGRQSYFLFLHHALVLHALLLFT